MDVGDLVLQTANAPGTATFNLIAPVPGRVSFVSGPGVGSGKYYVAHDGTNWEKGDGTVTAGSPDTLSRDHVLRNSLGTTTKINFTSTVTLISDVPAERAIYAIADNGSVALAGRVMTGAAAGFAADHLPRFDQVGNIRYPTYVASGGIIAVPLPNGTDLFHIDLMLVTPTTTVPLYFRVSESGGVSYLSGTTEYSYANVSGVSTTVAASTGAISYAPLGLQSIAASNALFGEIEIYPSSRTWRSRTYGWNGSAIAQEFTSGNWTTVGTATHILIGAVSGSLFSGGLARLSQKGI